MGLLDDAIREHLDLKRRSGADPVEVERAAREALGPVRRAPANVDSDQELEGDQELKGDQVRAYDHEIRGDLGPTHDYERDAGNRVEFEEEVEAEPSHTLPAPHRAADFSSAWEALAPEEPPASAEPPGAQEPPLAAPGATGPRESDAIQWPAPHRAGAEANLAEETVEYHIDHAHANGPAKEGEDVLEEIPEFLQDAPEHDRLWFEQRPPRDFDFDG